MVTIHDDNTTIPIEISDQTFCNPPKSHFIKNILSFQFW